MKIFDGAAMAAAHELALASDMQTWAEKHHSSIGIGAIVFAEDQGSQLYTRFKREAAIRLGMKYEVKTFPMRANLDDIFAAIEAMNNDSSITGIIVQKPWTKTWLDVVDGGASKDDFKRWWEQIVERVDPRKDVDGLTSFTHQAILDGSWQKKKVVLPATVKATLAALSSIIPDLTNQKIVVVGKSDLLGRPISYLLKQLGAQVELIGKKGLDERIADGRKLKDAQIIISCTGRAGLITGDLISEGVIIIDAGEPRPDVDRSSVDGLPSFITPVPGGIGPMTVISLLENAFDLANYNLV